MLYEAGPSHCTVSGIPYRKPEQKLLPRQRLDASSLSKAPAENSCYGHWCLQDLDPRKILPRRIGES